MKKSILLVSALLVVALILTACGPTDEGEIPADAPGFNDPMSDPTPGEIPGIGVTPTAQLDTQEPADPAMEATPTAAPVETETLPATPPPAEETPASTPQTGETGEGTLRGAQVVPDTGREQATLLSELLGYSIVDQNGTNLGSVDDFILNLCEAHIVYVVLDADPTLNLENGNMAVFPYETVTLENGIIDVDQRVITVNLASEQFSSAPSTNERFDLATTDWEADIRSHWSEVGRLSNLSTECRVPAAGSEGSARQTITRIEYATEVLDMQLQDGNGNLIGQVEEVLVEPESGWLPFMAIRPNENLQAGSGLILVPFGALNIAANEDGATQNLVLLVEPDILENAPTVDSLPSPGGWEGNAFQYWSQHVPMTREELP
jgi:sporulation protein YlmC with PRC-barrel domain